VAFKFRSKRESPQWRARWDGVLFFSGFVPSLVFGVAMGNVLQGVPFRFGADMHIFYDGGFFGLLNPFAILCGLVSVAMLVMHGAAWLLLKTAGPVAERARTYANYAAHPWTLAAPAAGFVGALGALLGLVLRRPVLALLTAALGIAGIILSVGASMFPFILPSSIDPRASLTVWDSSSSHLTLFIMLVVTGIFIPIIVAYTTWVYHVLWGKVDEKAIREDSGHAY
jgi:cytochrome d ubiquinol oxidase subunit II